MSYNKIHLYIFFEKNNKNSLRAFEAILQPHYDFSNNKEKKKHKRSSSLCLIKHPYNYNQNNFSDLQKMYLKYQIEKKKITQKKKSDIIKFYSYSNFGSGNWEGMLNKNQIIINKGKKCFPEKNNYHKSIDDLSNEKQNKNRFYWGNISHFNNYIPKV